MRRLGTTILALLISIFTWSQSNISAGPMLGHIDMLEANIWVSTVTGAKVELSFREKGTSKDFQTTSSFTSGQLYPTATLKAFPLEPGVEYEYYISVNGQKENEVFFFKTEPLWQFRTDPPAFSVAIGSCAFLNEEKYDRPGKSYGSNYEIFDQIALQKPDIMLWMGDNIYLREVDFESTAAIERRYMLFRTNQAIKKLWPICAHYAIWDDHDFGPNDSNSSYVFKGKTLEAFQKFWMNPPAALDKGITTKFSYGDAEFFLLDNRYFRTDSKSIYLDRTILGVEQMKWLFLALSTSKAKYKFVVMGGQFLNTAAKFENYATYPEERKLILDFIGENKIENVIFLTGDRHCTELSETTLTNDIRVYDLTVSPLTSGAYDISNEANSLRVKETIVAEQNFGVLHFSGPSTNRQLQIQIFNARGEEKWSKTIY